MEPLSAEARDRVRATSLWLVAGLVLLGVVLGLYGVLVGYTSTTVTRSVVVSVSDDGREVTVDVEHGGCQQPAGIDVEESDDVVLITAYASERRPLQGQACPAILEHSREVVTLQAPAGDRELRAVQP